MDGRNLINALAFIASAVNALRSPGSFQRPVCIDFPCFPPDLGLSVVVPVNCVLPVIFPAAFPVRDAFSLCVQIIDLAALGTPFAGFFQQVDCQHDVGVGISGSFVMDGKISTHPNGHKVVFHKSADKG